jgi:hypothetical protein
MINVGCYHSFGVFLEILFLTATFGAKKRDQVSSKIPDITEGCTSKRKKQ